MLKGEKSRNWAIFKNTERPHLWQKYINSQTNFAPGAGFYPTEKHKFWNKFEEETEEHRMLKQMYSNRRDLKVQFSNDHLRRYTSTA